ncbi:hypothetical protein H2204_002640 [Knufia peltigerae]|uniref:Uncharacterized protein n=1 Tax=Knufia peltigerae TaxID=1002370 RepID=A0AA38YB45_9EURO|nr:hypothetical protein H2204_002640 [Knufia peltigerae]
MSIITQLVTATAIATFSPTVLTDTVTCYIATTLPASAGQTVTINLPPVVPPPMPTTKYTPSPPTAATVTAKVKLVVCTPLALESTHGYTEHGSRDVNCATDNGKRANSALQ